MRVFLGMDGTYSRVGDQEQDHWIHRGLVRNGKIHLIGSSIETAVRYLISQEVV